MLYIAKNELVRILIAPYWITFKLHMWVLDDERRNPIYLGPGVKSQGRLWHSVYKSLWELYRLQYMFKHFQTSHVGCGWLEEILGHGVISVGQGLLCPPPPARGCHALRCLVFSLYERIIGEDLKYLVCIQPHQYVYQNKLFLKKRTAVVQITDFLEFLHEYCKERSETCKNLKLVLS